MDWNTFIFKVKGVFAFKLLTVAGTQITVATLLTFLAILIGTFYLSHMLQRGFDRVLERSGLSVSGDLGAGKRLLYYLAVVPGFGVALEAFGINFNSLFAAGPVFAVAVGPAV